MSGPPPAREAHPPQARAEARGELVREGCGARVIGERGSWLLDHDLTPSSDFESRTEHAAILYADGPRLVLVWRIYVEHYGQSVRDTVFFSDDGGASFQLQPLAAAPEAGFLQRLDFD